jgi:hypothetical protein
LVASVLGAMLVALLTRVSILRVLGWALILESFQVPFLAAARRGHLDTCTSRLRRLLGGRQSAA